MRAQHWPEYLIEAWALGAFMVSAALVTALLEHPSSPVHQLLPNGNARRALIGLAMGLTAIGLIYSPWGQQSGAHMNPATTLTFLRLGKVQPWDAVFYISAQFIGGLCGVLLAKLECSLRNRVIVESLERADGAITRRVLAVAKEVAQDGNVWATRVRVRICGESGE